MNYPNYKMHGNKFCFTVLSVTPNKDYTLLLAFADGTKRLYDAKPLLEKPIYADLKSLPFFLSAKAEYGTVVWSNDIDIAPESLYENSKLL